ncbi:carbon storage regulator CsrA [Paenibacillus yanchengensis]|uniref:Translational regulator CsrA n=1 Tax=Paenibacillus yanchengensis TaxID=2035833 RepID=A0ABW4YMV0_9BACL
MLVLKRKVGEVIKIGDEIEVHVLAVEGDVIKLGFEAPQHIQILRSELYEEIETENKQAILQQHEQKEKILDIFKKK